MSKAAPIIDKCGMMPIAACVFATILSPLMIEMFNPPPYTLASIMEVRPENRVFWPVMFAISIALAARNRARLTTLTWPPHIICLAAFLCLAGASVLWAFKPESALTRFVQEVMVVTSIVVPAMLAAPSVDLIRGLFLCFALAAVLNVIFVFEGSQVVAIYGAAKVNIGYPGYFTGKNLLGEFAVVALLLSFHETLYPGSRRVFGVILAVTAAALIFWANSKTALGLAIVAPALAGLTLLLRKATRISVAVLLLLIPACYIALSMFAGLNINRISFILYGDSTLTGRTVIWDFALSEIARHPLLGWGYKSFWLVGSDAPSVVDAPAWVKQMPNSHNGYYDVMLELGYVGLALLVSFLITTLHALGRMADRDRTRAWIVLSLILFVIFYNFLESLWFRAFDLIWVVFVVLVAEAARYRQSEALIGSTDHRSRLSRTLPPLPSRWRRPPPRVQLLIGRGTTASSVRRN